MKLQFGCALFAVLILSSCSVVSPREAKSNLYADELPSFKHTTNVVLFPVIPSRRQGITASEAKTINKELIEQLQGQGLNVVLGELSQQKYADYRVVNRPQSAQARPAAYAEFIDESGKNGVHVFPSVQWQMAELKGALAHWDGARQELRMIGGSGLGDWSGNRRAHSLKLEVFDDSGNWVMTTFGGISFPVVAVMRTRELIRKDDLFEHYKDQKALTRGVQVAIAPFNKVFDKNNKN